MADTRIEELAGRGRGIYKAARLLPGTQLEEWLLQVSLHPSGGWAANLVISPDGKIEFDLRVRFQGRFPYFLLVEPDH